MSPGGKNRAYHELAQEARGQLGQLHRALREHWHHIPKGIGGAGNGGDWVEGHIGGLHESSNLINSLLERGNSKIRC